MKDEEVLDTFKQEPDFRKRIENKVDKILVCIHGNGTKGLKSRIEANETHIKVFWAFVLLTMGALCKYLL